MCKFFFTPENLIDAFDVVVSFGVVEHFEDSSKACILQVSKTQRNYRDT